jgi:hypothetical protein
VNDPDPLASLVSSRGLVPDFQRDNGSGTFEWLVRWSYPGTWTESEIEAFEAQARRLVEVEETPWAGPQPGDPSPPDAGPARTNDSLPEESPTFPTQRGVA